MKQEALIAWTSLYIAVGIMALMCAVLAVLVTAYDWRTGRWRRARRPLDHSLLPKSGFAGRSTISKAHRSSSR